MTTPDARLSPQGGEGWEPILNSVSLYNICGRRKCRNSRPRVKPVESGADGCSTPQGSYVFTLVTRRLHLRLMIFFPFGEFRGL